MNSIAEKNISIGIVRKYKKYFILSLKLFITIGIIYYIISFVNFSEVFSAIENANYYFIIAAFALSFLNLFLQYWKWESVCNFLLEEKDKKKIFLSLFYGFSAGVFTPARIGEYFGRGVALKDKSLIKITAATFIDKFFPLLSVTIFGSLAFIFYLNKFFNFPIYFSLPIFLGIVLSFYFLIFLLIRKRLFTKMLRGEGKLSRQFQKLIIKLKFLKRLNKNISIKLFFISFLFYICYLLQFAILFAAFSFEINFINYFWAAVLIMFAKTIIPQVTLAEFGIREGTSIYFLTQLGGTAGAALNASISLFLINLAFPAIIGMILLYKKNND